jgi:hypothetical protein
VSTPQRVSSTHQDGSVLGHGEHVAPSPSSTARRLGRGSPGGRGRCGRASSRSRCKLKPPSDVGSTRRDATNTRDPGSSPGTSSGFLSLPGRAKPSDRGNSRQVPPRSLTPRSSAVRQRVGLITRRSPVRIRSPLRSSSTTAVRGIDQAQCRVQQYRRTSRRSYVVAQLGSATASQAVGRRFKSYRRKHVRGPGQGRSGLRQARVAQR